MRRTPAARAHPAKVRAARRSVSVYVQHYNCARPHRSLDLQAPQQAGLPARRATATTGYVERIDRLGGLVHEYRRAA